MTALAMRLFRGDLPAAALDPADRGLAYGDGVFTTARVRRGGVVWWSEHVARLAAGAARLGFAAPAAGWLEREVEALLAEAPAEAVLKIILTRGCGGRGYAPPSGVESTRLLALFPLPPPSPPALALRWCDLRWSHQPALAGIKHLNRLEQVLARAECTDPGIDDGLMCDHAGNVVGATSANVFALVDGRWCTPVVTDAGIAGIARGWLLAHAGARETRLTPDQLENADAVFLCNAVRGILPVGSLGARRWSMPPALDALRRQLGRSEPAFA